MDVLKTIQAMKQMPDLTQGVGSALLDQLEAHAIKAGRRHSAGDEADMQAIHDLACKQGALCAIENAAPKSLDPETLVVYGAEVKALGNGKVGGYLVRFSTDKDPDLTGDFFTADTDFGELATTDVLYQHGLDRKIGKRVIGSGTLRKDDVGVWVEAQLKMRDEYERMIYDLAEKGKLGWSSGTLPARVERKPSGKADWVARWPLGLDASLTPIPAEPRTAAVPLKSLAADPALLLDGSAPELDSSLGDDDWRQAGELFRQSLELRQ